MYLLLSVSQKDLVGEVVAGEDTKVCLQDCQFVCALGNKRHDWSIQSLLDASHEMLTETQLPRMCRRHEG